MCLILVINCAVYEMVVLHRPFETSQHNLTRRDACADLAKHRLLKFISNGCEIYFLLYLLCDAYLLVMIYLIILCFNARLIRFATSVN